MAFVLIKTYFLNCLLLYFHLNDDFALFFIKSWGHQPTNQQTDKQNRHPRSGNLNLFGQHSFPVAAKTNRYFIEYKILLFEAAETLRLLNESLKNWNNTQLIHYFSQDWTNKTAQLLKLGITLLKLFFESG